MRILSRVTLSLFSSRTHSFYLDNTKSFFLPGEVSCPLCGPFIPASLGFVPGNISETLRRVGVENNQCVVCSVDYLSVLTGNRPPSGNKVSEGLEAHIHCKKYLLKQVSNLKISPSEDNMTAFGNFLLLFTHLKHIYGDRI